MKSIKANFYKELNKDENIGEYPALVKAVRYEKFKRRTLRKNLHLLNDKDMDESIKKQLVEHLYKESQKDLEESLNGLKNLSHEELLHTS